MNNKGSEALFQASSTCKLRLVRMLVEGGTSVNVRNERLQTPLMLCCQAEIDMDEKGRVVSYLLGKQAKVNLQDIEGRTALIYACMSNSGKEIIKALLDAKSNPWIEDESKNTVFDYVMNAEDLETTRLLINACRESMIAEARDNIQVKHIEECLANIQDIRKFSWPLMGPRVRRGHSYLYAAEKEDPPFSSNNLLGAELGGDDGETPQPERRRKRSVCHFDPLDIQEILNCSEETKTGTRTSTTEVDQDDKSESEEKRKTSVRSLSEEERFSFQISDAENASRDPSSGLEKLLKLQDSFCSSLDSNEFPCTSDSRRNSKDKCHTTSVSEHIGDETNSNQGGKSVINPDKLENGDQQILGGDSIQERKIVLSSKEVEKVIQTKYTDRVVSGEEAKSEQSSSYSLTERSKTVDSQQYKMFSEESSTSERLFTFRASSAAVSKTESYTSVSENSIQTLRHVAINSAIDKAFVQNTENRSNRIISPVNSQQSSPVMSPLASPRVTRRVTHTAVTVKQSPRASPVPIAENNRREAVPIVRRYTMSAMDMGKFQNAGVKTLLALPKHTGGAENDTSRGSAVLESTCGGGPEGSFTPPGLRKSKSDLTDWTSMQGKEYIEIGPKQGPGIQQLTDHGKEGNAVPEFLLPSISSAKTGRRSPKDFIQSMPVISPASNADSRIESALPWRNNGEKHRFYLGGQEFPLDEQRRSPSPSQTSLPSSPKDLAISSSYSPCDVIAIAKAADLSPRGQDNTSGDVLPDLLFNSATKSYYSEESSSKQGGSSMVTPQNFNNRTFTPSSNVPEERNTASCHNHQRPTNRRPRPGTLLPPLTINNRRSPTHELEDGYFSGSPSPADVESPRRKSSNEQQRYSFRPISPRSPVRSPKLFNSQAGKLPPSR